ncbi:MAG TPA: hypothetical protein VFT62_08850 [Mycobacteriales bacterium]|nr:hypothetical protein [Mycobacteriales bacterium]
MRRRVIAWAMAGAAAVMVAGCDVLVVIHHQHGWPHGYSYWLEGSLSIPVWLAIGLLITIRVPGNRLGWLGLSLSVCTGVQLFSGALATQLAGTGSGSAAVNWLAAVSAAGQIGVVGGLMVFGYLAPSGRLVSRRWRPMFVALLVGLTLVVLNSMLTDSGVRNEVAVAHAPLTVVPSSVLHAGLIVANVIVVFALPAGVASLALRYRRGGTVERQQLKWMLFAATTAAFLAVVVQRVADRLWPGAELPGTIIWAIIGCCLPVGIGIAVLRYRLYDVDRIVSRTVSYLLVTGSVVGMYVGGVALVDGVLGFSSSVAVAASTLAAAAVFQPLRRRLQAMVDRRFDRAAYDARRTVEAFAVRLRDQVDVDAVRDDLLATVERSIAPSTATLWLVAA